jgi:predicted AlkP superfamily phosphohydrolase/phosphomutase
MAEEACLRFSDFLLSTSYPILLDVHAGQNLTRSVVFAYNRRAFPLQRSDEQIREDGRRASLERPDKEAVVDLLPKRDDKNKTKETRLSVMNKKQVFVLGLDGATLGLLNRKALPNIKTLIENGISGELLSRPAVTPVAWTSMVTGVNPGKHGIFGFRKGDKLINSQHKKAKELWDYLRSIVINVPMTYPARPIDGVMITGMMTPSIGSDGFVYPESERAHLKEIGYVIEPEIELSQIEESIRIRVELTKYYAFAHDWQLLFHVFREYDSLQHFFWGQELQYYQMVDKLIAELRQSFPFAYFMIVSDHGFTQVDKTFNLPRWLEENFRDEAWAGGWGAIYIRAKTERSRVKRELVNKLKNIKHENRAVLEVYQQEEVYWGPYAEQGPDVIVSPKREHGFTFGSSESAIIDRSKKKNGCHLEEAAFVLAGPEIRKKEVKGRIYDVFPTLLRLFEINTQKDLDGHPLV